MDIEMLMQELADTGASPLIKCDGERVSVGGRPWTFVVAGGPFVEAGYVHREDVTLDACIQKGLRSVKEKFPDWEWVDLHLEE
ncbi:hypothetical protein ACTPOK_22610 [Streptomyces inhibens]|uniref:hypothetical protein n=1 Tax=Streptomyces inhibens TaxID=2293571 RepID=UPI00402A8667